MALKAVPGTRPDQGAPTSPDKAPRPAPMPLKSRKPATPAKAK